MSYVRFWVEKIDHRVIEGLGDERTIGLNHRYSYLYIKMLIVIYTSFITYL